MPVAREVLERLRGYSTPTVSNGLEQLNVRPWNEGFMGPEIRCLFPELGPMVGHAVTATIRAAMPDTNRRGPSRSEYYDYVLSIPEPRVLVIQDLDPRPVGAFWGEVQSHVHRALGVEGVVTNGGVRDLDEVRELGFHFFAAAVLVSHAYVHLVDIGTPVEVGGLVVRPGELVHADKHGVMTIPEEAADRIEEGIAKVLERERRIIAAADARPFDLERLKQVFG